MGTEKRERQKANKAKREQEVARQAARSRSIRIGVLVVGAIVAVFLLVFIAGRFIDDGDETQDTVVTEQEPSEPTPTVVPAESVADTALGEEEGVAEASVGCPPVEGSDEQIQEFDGPPPMCLDPDVSYSATITTTAGEVTARLDQEQAPNTVNNFVFLARYNYFDDTVCHRVINGFVTQCGDPTATGQGGPGYQFADELPEAGAYEIGSLAMANSGPDTNGSQFFIISGESGTELPPLYSLFGQIDQDDLDVVAEMDSRGSLDDSGVATEEIRIVDVEIIES